MESVLKSKEDENTVNIGRPKEAEMEELEEEYMHLRDEEQDILRNLIRQKDDDLLKGQAVKNQKALWDKTLEFRFLLQKTFSSSNKLPQEPVKSAYCSINKEVDEAYSELIASSEQTLNCFLELQEALLGNNPSIANAAHGKADQSFEKGVDLPNSDGVNDEVWSRIYGTYCSIAHYRDTSIDKWQRKTQVTTGAAAFKGKFHAFNQNISEQVYSYMRDPSKMIKRMQLSKSAVGTFGNVIGELDNSIGQDENSDGDPNLIDDSDFYQQLLKEFFETIDPNSAETAFYALNRLQSKKRKVVDRRASKNRKIRYNVHEKMVNFMAPQPVILPEMATKLFQNLFGLQK